MKRIVIIGPESTGKSTLSGQLAAHYGTVWCPEYAREYLLANGTDYSEPDLLRIAKGQLELDAKLQATAGHGLYFIDTDMYVMKIWSEVVFGSCHTFILKQLALRRTDLYLLCAPDLPWQPDELREYPDLGMRRRLYHMYRDHLVNNGAPWTEIRGSNNERLQRAVAAVNGLSI